MRFVIQFERVQSPRSSLGVMRGRGGEEASSTHQYAKKGEGYAVSSLLEDLGRTEEGVTQAWQFGSLQHKRVRAAHTHTKGLPLVSRALKAMQTFCGRKKRVRKRARKRSEHRKKWRKIIMEMSTWNFCTNSKLFSPPPPQHSASVRSDSGRICSTFRMRRPFLAQLEFQTQLNFMFDMAIPGHAPPSPLWSSSFAVACESVQKFSLFCFGFAIRSGRRREIFNAISIGFNSRKSQIWKLKSWQIPATPSAPARPHSQRQSKAWHDSSAGAWQFWLRRDLPLPNICI